MSKIKEIKALIGEEMKEFDGFFKKAVKSKVPLLDIVMNYIIRRKGKQMRPMFVFLAAKLFGDIKKSTYTAATLIELMHTATLIHDDVVDDADKRRGFFSINALWKSKIAVLTGDFLLSKGLLLAVNNKEYKLLEIVSEAVKEMAEGELLQIEKSRKLDITEETYFEIIYKKTATLIASCSAAGAKSAGANDDEMQHLKEFGKYAGIAFQIKDDLFDYQKTNLTGKPTGNDIQEKKITLPLIFALSKAEKSEKRHILRIIQKHNSNKEKVEIVMNFVKSKGGLEYTEEKMNEYKNMALGKLITFPESEAKKALSDLVEYITTRKK
ncbi:MAG: polyprenyl synthetase family protein [Bacteroidales bacterium]|nr:polyprenyl synthetase family protein [Bacteroidales bacterium]